MIYDPCPIACSSCGRMIVTACESCRQQHKLRIQRLESMPCGIPAEDPDPFKMIVRTREETCAIKAAAHWVQRMIKLCPCSGNKTIWKDDASGASSGWDSVVRAYEDIDLEEYPG